MRWLTRAVVVLFIIPPVAAESTTHYLNADAPRPGDGTLRSPWRDLQEAIDRAGDRDTLRLAAGTYVAVPEIFEDPLCGNCKEHQFPVTASRGFLIQDKSLSVIGAGLDATVLETLAGYGVFFVNSAESRLEGVKVTAGRRDADGDATNAAVVARWSRVTITRCALS